MLHLALPHINVLSKIDLAEKFGKLHFGLDFYREVSRTGVASDTPAGVGYRWIEYTKVMANRYGAVMSVSRALIVVAL